MYYFCNIVLQFCITIDNITVKASREVKLLGIKIDNKFHIPRKCAQKVTKKVEHWFVYDNILLYKELALFLMLTYYQFLITVLWMFCSTIMEIDYMDNCEKRHCIWHHKQFKTLFREHMVRLNIISLYIYIYIQRLKT